MEYMVKLVGTQPLLMHHDNISWADAMSAWRKDPDNRPWSVKGDDRSPAWTWVGSLYIAGGNVVIPTDNIRSALKKAGARIPHPARRAGTCKELSQSGLLMPEIGWTLHTCSGAPVSAAPTDKAYGEHDMQRQEAIARAMGATLFLKRAAVGATKHVRVRPRWDSGWSVSGIVRVLDETITRSILESMFRIAGRDVGLCDWRPGSPKAPGPCGTFLAEVV